MLLAFRVTTPAWGRCSVLRWNKTMEQNLEHTISLLASTPAALDGLLRDLPEEWTLCGEGETTWCARDVVGHLIDGERVDWMPRARMILEHGEARAFEPLNRVGFRE